MPLGLLVKLRTTGLFNLGGTYNRSPYIEHLPHLHSNCVHWYFLNRMFSLFCHEPITLLSAHMHICIAQVKRDQELSLFFPCHTILYSHLIQGVFINSPPIP